MRVTKLICSNLDQHEEDRVRFNQKFKIAAWLLGFAFLVSTPSTAQTLSPELKPDFQRVRSLKQQTRTGKPRENGYRSAAVNRTNAMRYSSGARATTSSSVAVARPFNFLKDGLAPKSTNSIATTPIL